MLRAVRITLSHSSCHCDQPICWNLQQGAYVVGCHNEHRGCINAASIQSINVNIIHAVCVLQLQYRLSATGVRGSLEITRVDWDQYKLKYKLKTDRRSTSRFFRVAGVQNQFRAFLNMVGDWRHGDSPTARLEKGAVSPATPSPPQRRNRFEETPVATPPTEGGAQSSGAPEQAKSGKDRSEQQPEWRGRPEEGFWDLALAAAIIESGETGSTTAVPSL
jgi:hypothetical protein